MTYNKLNITIGWILFVLTSTLYLITIEPTVSLWDCGEFITAAYKLEICHAPGAPFFILLGRIFSLFAGNDTTMVAMMVNSVSAIASAFTIIFLFWTITWFARKTVSKSGMKNPVTKLYILGSGVIGSIAFMVSDSFWFSAVEGELYALSSLLTAIVFWAILKWETEQNESKKFKWILLIAYLIGLSIGVHLLNLLAIPAIGLVYYFKNYKPSIKGLFVALIVSCIILACIVFVFIPGIVKVAGWFELLFVNGFNLPYHSGAVAYIILIISVFIFLLYYSYQKRKAFLYNIVTAILFLFLGYSSYITIIIRSNANPPIDQGNPENVFSLLYYLNREQYGSRPLIYGAYYNAPVKSTSERYTYIQYNGKYVKEPMNPDVEYDKRFYSFFTRMHDRSDDKKEAYNNWLRTGRKVKTIDRNDNAQFITIPSFKDNLKYFFKYQIGHMYFRYFMWNFAGRQNDILSHGSIIHGNWLSGIKFIDEFRLGTQEELPDYLANNKARNKYYCLPLILGLIGLIYHHKKNKQGFLIVSLLFILTGIAIVVYLNEVPVIPRERDYVYTGSYYAFSVWIGLGVLATCKFVEQKIKKSSHSIIAASAILCSLFILVPINILKENFDDHDRSNRYIARDLASNYLNSCDRDAILFTTADNDTYPIWYAQEVEGIRKDIRVILSPFIHFEWFVDQIKKESYDSNKVNISFTRDKLVQGKRDYMPILSKINRSVELKTLLEFVANDHSKTKLGTYDSNLVDYLPSKKYHIPIHKKNIIDSGIANLTNINQFPDSISASIKGNYLTRGELIILDIIAQNEWKRPIYFLNNIIPRKLGLENYLKKEGFAYRLIPFKNNSEKLYDNSEKQFQKFAHQFSWGNMDDENVYIDYTSVRSISLILRYRETFGQIAADLIANNEFEKAEKTLDTCTRLFSSGNIPHDIFSPTLIDLYHQINQNEKANQNFNELEQDIKTRLDYFKQFGKRHAQNIEYDIRTNLYIYQQLVQLSHKFSYAINKELENNLRTYIEYWQGLSII